MRVTVPLTAGFLALAFTASARSEPVPYTAFITQPEADVRSGPGTGQGFYTTNRLHANQRVVVLKERVDGWLEIKPPDGSFSWINSASVSQVVPSLPNYVVMTTSNTGVSVLMGSEFVKQRPTVEAAKLQRGAQLRAIGRPLADNDGTWLPIEPPPGEVRYLQAQAIARPVPQQPAQAPSPPPPPTPTITAARVASSPGAGPAGSFQNPTQAGSALAPFLDVNALWQQATQAERAGNINEAIRLYTQVGNESASSNRQLAIDAYNRAHFLRDSNRNAGSTFTPAAGQAINPVVAPVPPSTAPSFQAPAQATARLIAPTNQDAYATSSSGPGRLRVSGRYLVPNQRLYVLQNNDSLPIVYAAPQPGIDLEPYVGHSVELFGPTYYQNTLRANFLSVLRVVPLD